MKFNIKKASGFTLIELMIAVAIISILMAVAYPAYEETMQKSRRADAKASLQAFAQAMEQYYTTEGTYAGAATGGADTGAPTIFSTKSPIDGSETFYNLTIVSSGVSTYTLGAEPVDVQDGDGALILLSTGTRGWDQDNSGSGVADESYISDTEWCWKESC